MKKLFISLLVAASLILSGKANAANTATDLGPIMFYVSGVPVEARMVLVHYDTTGTDLTVATAQNATSNVCAMGQFQSSSASMTLTFKPDSSHTLPLSLAANQGLYQGSIKDLGLCSVRGNNFIINSTGAFDALFYIVQNTLFRR